MGTVMCCVTANCLEAHAHRPPAPVLPPCGILRCWNSQVGTVWAAALRGALADALMLLLGAWGFSEGCG